MTSAYNIAKNLGEKTKALQVIHASTDCYISSPITKRRVTERERVFSFQTFFFKKSIWKQGLKKCKGNKYCMIAPVNTF